MSAERALPRAVYTTTPYPLEHGTTATFGAVFANGGPEVLVHRVEIAVPGGYDMHHNDGQGAPLFAKWAAAYQPETHETTHGGNWTWVSEKLLVWEHPIGIPVKQGEAQEWLIDIPITSDTDVVTSVEPRSSRGASAVLTFDNGFEARGTSWGPTPGMIRVRVPPDDLSTPDLAEGYPWTPAEEPEAEAEVIEAPEGDPLEATSSGSASASGGAASVEHPMGLRMSLPWATLEEETTYTTVPDGSDLVNLEGALSNSTFAVKNRLAPVGSFVQVDANLESVMTDLSKRGVDETTLTVDLYAPPHVGCEPTRTLTLPQQSLPTADVTAVALWDGDGTGQDSLFLAASDGRAYRIDAVDGTGLVVPEGVQRWSVELAGAATTIATATWSPLERDVLVGDAAGNVTAIDARTGAIRWSHKMASGGVASVLADTARGDVFVASTTRIIERLDPASGSTQATWGAGLLGEVSPLLSWGPDGALLVRTTGDTWRLDPATLAVWGNADVAGSGPVVVASERLRFVTDEELRSVAYPSLSSDRTDRVLADAPALSAAADLNGDDADDLVILTETLAVEAWDGATGQRLWSAPAPEGHLPEVSLTHTTPLRALSDSFVDCGVDVETTYTSDASCQPQLMDTTGLDKRPLLLHASHEGVAFAYQWEGASWVAVMDAEGANMWTRQLKGGTLPVALARGEWTGKRALVVTSDDGLARIFDTQAVNPATAAALYQQAPASHLGRFSLHLPVPSGGFYGAHLLVATISWVDEAQQTRSAHLSDWFVAVGADGKPVVEPAYRIVLVVDPPDD